MSGLDRNAVRIPSEQLSGFGRNSQSWPVDDAATYSFVTRFYEYLDEEGDPASALALAQAHTGTADAACWGAFFLTGG